MKKSIIGAIVGGLLIFFWQFVSWTTLDLHRPAQEYHPKQDSILSYLSATLEKDGGYLLPTVPKGTSFEEANKMGEQMVGKPWASVQYHSSYTITANEMYMNMVRGLVTSIFMVWLLIWIIAKWNKIGFVNVLLACLFTGLIVFINEPYGSYIWYKIFDVRAHLLDALAGWGLCGIWLGWWMGRKGYVNN
ncbi:MAG: hypothetical protein M0Q26_13235 [Chitinophagaceae bacterium]|nr:hypothetical protein [Chitinophagaceae bacterium]MDP1764476.1 hypothetical protein [Sediminibacterium sp.]MDP1812623.1 hypothetical protein [Sediminibacterium sp.]MDP3127510.1 hypothetical protein [Sediminibacterium sp.]MDP3665863.1 hypothetical protein [Sediminibacterium sp.]